MRTREGSSLDSGKQDPARKNRHLSLVGPKSETAVEKPPSRRATTQEIMTLLGVPVLAVLAVLVVMWLY
jgi:hypothetical protein